MQRALTFEVMEDLLYNPVYKEAFVPLDEPEIKTDSRRAFLLEGQVIRHDETTEAFRKFSIILKPVFLKNLTFFVRWALLQLSGDGHRTLTAHLDFKTCKRLVVDAVWPD